MSYGSINYNDTYDQPDLVDCLDCNKRFLAYPDGIDLCTNCILNHKDLKYAHKLRPKPINIEHLF